MYSPQGLDEISEDELTKELERRSSLREAGKCDYCERFGDTKPCKFPDRHFVAELTYQKAENEAQGVPNRYSGIPIHMQRPTANPYKTKK